METTFERLAIAITGLYLVTVAARLFDIPIPVLGPVIGFVAVIIVPGALFMRLIGIRPRVNFTWLPYVIGVGLILTMGIWFFINIVLLAIGYTRPLSTIPVVISIGITTTLLATAVREVHDPYEISIDVPVIEELSPVLLLSALLPLAGILAVTYLNTTGRALPLIIVLCVIATVPVVVAAMTKEPRHLPLVIWAISLTIVYHKSLWIGHQYGGHLSAIFNWKTAQWAFTGGTLLPNTILLPGMAHALGIDILTQMDVVLPLIMSFLPVTLYVSFRAWVGNTKAFLGACLFAFAHPFYLLYPSTPRAGFPVFFLGLLGALIGDQRLNGMRMRFLVLLFGIGVAVSHYGTSYYVLFAIIGALLTLYVFAAFDYLVDLWKERDFVGDGGSALISSRYQRLAGLSSSRVITREFGVFYSTVVIGWYLYVGDGKRFEGVIEQIINAYLDVFLNTGGMGSTTARLNTDYGAISIFLSKHLYLVIASLTGLGLATCFLRRVITEWETRFSDGFLSFAAHLFILFGGTIIISNAWGGGRPLMIVLSLNAIFTVIGIETIVLMLKRAAGYVGEILTTVDESGLFLKPKTGVITNMSFAILIAVFLVLNSGVMAAVVFDGAAPTIVPSRDVEDIHITTDVATHVWFTDHRNASRKIYGDQETYGSAADAMNGEIAARSQRGTYRIHGGGNLRTLNRTGIESGYVVLLGHNIMEGIVVESYIITKPIEAYDLDLERRSRIYTTGKSEIYFSNKTGDL